MTRILRGSGALVALGITIVVLHGMARFDLRGPTGFSSDELSMWFDDPTLVIATILRWLALFLAYYLAAIIVALTLFGKRVEDGPFGRLVPSWVASTAGVLLGITAVGAPLAVHMTSHDGPSSAPAAAAQPLALHELDAPLTLDQVAPGDGHPDVAAQAQGVVEHGVTAAADPDSRWTVRSGDSFWSIAEETVLDERGGGTARTISDEDIAEYWRILIAANHDRLIEPGNPDLILPGQELTLPPVP